VFFPFILRHFMGIVMEELTGDNRFLSAAEEGSIGGSLLKNRWIG
jgi:hypothetical protein